MIINLIKELEQLECNNKEMHQKIIKACKKLSRRYDSIIKNADKWQKLFLEINEELNEYKNELEKKVKEEVNKRIEQEKLLLDKSKLITLGELMDSMAHQLKQPLQIISTISANLQLKLAMNQCDKSCDELLKKIDTTIAHMSETINDFRNFLKTKNKESFDLKESIQKAKTILDDRIKKNNITINIKFDKEIKIKGIENEFTHILLNLINNSIDEFEKQNRYDGVIDIDIKEDDKYIDIIVSDNAGGVKEEYLDKMFESNFSTKGKKGSGMGLYMTKLIVEKMGGDIKAYNQNNGLTFKIRVKK